MSSRHVVLTSEQEDLKAMLRDLELKDKANNNVYGEFLTSNTILACQHGVKKQSLGSSSLKYTKIGNEEVLIDKDKNIRGTFGVCKSPKFAGLSSTTTIQVSASESIDGTAKTVGGHMCYMQLAQKWGALIKEIMVYDSSTHDYREIPTTNSYILCHYGQGCIYPIDSGQRVTVNNTQGSGQVTVTLGQMLNQTVTWAFREVASYNLQTSIPTYLNPNSGRAITQADVDEINRVMDDYEINKNPKRVRHFLAQCHAETEAGFCPIERYDNNPLTDQRFKNYEAQGNTLGNIPNSGDGYKYRGAGAIQLTGRTSYKVFSEYIGDSKILSDGALYVGQNYFWEAGAFYWSVYKPNSAVASVQSLPGNQWPIYQSQAGSSNRFDLNGKCDAGASVFDISDIVYGNANDPVCDLPKRTNSYNYYKSVIN